MDTAHRIKVVSELGHIILNSHNKGIINLLKDAIKNAHIANPWFTSEFCSQAIHTLATHWLNPDALKNWAQRYSLYNNKTQNPKRIAVIMAGNVPFVGFHDMLAVIITGNTFIGKTSSKDGGLMQAIIEMLKQIEPKMGNRLYLTDDKLPEFDAVIATGSDNSARYFEYYFAKYPNIIRKNRSSIAVLSGNESDNELKSLANDMFSYFGLGCRNVSTLLLPSGYNIIDLIPHFELYKYLSNHNKYANNYEYNRALYLMNSAPHLDNGFCLFVENQSIGSPVGVINYSYYESSQGVANYIEHHSDSLQCIVGHSAIYSKAIPFGTAQNPTLTDYADGMDTVDFLLGL